MEGVLGGLLLWWVSPGWGLSLAVGAGRKESATLSPAEVLVWDLLCSPLSRGWFDTRQLEQACFMHAAKRTAPALGSSEVSGLPACIDVAER